MVNKPKTVLSTEKHMDQECWVLPAYDNSKGVCTLCVYEADGDCLGNRDEAEHFPCTDMIEQSVHGTIAIPATQESYDKYIIGRTKAKLGVSNEET